jgi:hypothetical protein
MIELAVRRSIHYLTFGGLRKRLTGIPAAALAELPRGADRMAKLVRLHDDVT